MLSNEMLTCLALLVGVGFAFPGLAPVATDGTALGGITGGAPEVTDVIIISSEHRVDERIDLIIEDHSHGCLPSIARWDGSLARLDAFEVVGAPPGTKVGDPDVGGGGVGADVVIVGDLDVHLGEGGVATTTTDGLTASVDPGEVQHPGEVGAAEVAEADEVALAVDLQALGLGLGSDDLVELVAQLRSASLGLTTDDVTRSLQKNIRPPGPVVAPGARGLERSLRSVARWSQAHGPQPRRAVVIWRPSAVPRA